MAVVLPGCFDGLAWKRPGVTSYLSSGSAGFSKGIGRRPDRGPSAVRAARTPFRRTRFF